MKCFSGTLAGWSLATLAAINCVLAAGVQRKVEVVVTADNKYTAYINGEKFDGPVDGPTGYGWQQVRTLTKYIDPGDLVAAFDVRDEGVVAGFICSIFVDGKLVAETTETAGWRVQYGGVPATGWNSQAAFNDQSWSTVSYNGGVCPEDVAWVGTTSKVTIGGSRSKWLWGPQCNSIGNNNFYRLKLNTEPQTAPPGNDTTTDLALPKKMRRVDVLLTADNLWKAYINGQTFIGPDCVQNVQNISVLVESGPFVVAFQVTDTGGRGGFIASIFVDGELMSQTNENAGWRALYGKAPQTGWNQNLDFNTSSWSVVDSNGGVCSDDPSWFLTSPKVRVGGSQARWLWGPSCSSTLTTNYYRLKLNTDDDLVRFDIAYTADYEHELYIGTYKFTGERCGNFSNYGWTSPKAISLRVPPGPLLVAAHVKRCRTLAGFIGTISIDGCPANVTGITARTGWRTTINTPSCGWNSVIQFGDSASWSDVRAACPFYDGWGGVDVLLRNTGPEPSWIFGPDCGMGAPESWFRLVLNVPSPKLELKMVFSVGGPFQAVVAGRSLDKSAMVLAEQYKVFTIVKWVNPGDYVIAVEAKTSAMFKSSRGFIATVYLNGRVISGTGGGRGWQTSSGYPGANWNVDPAVCNVVWYPVHGACPLESVVEVKAVQDQVRSANSDARWMKFKNCATDTYPSLYYRTVLHIDKDTPTMTFSVVTASVTVTKTVTSTATYCPATTK